MTNKATLIRQYFDGGGLPWSTGYGEYRIEYVSRMIADEETLRRFRDGGSLPAGYGLRLDERVVEYPWLFSRSDGWGRLVLDAGSTLNYPEFFEHPALRRRRLIVCNLFHDYVARRANVSYLQGDLRQPLFRDESLDVIVCISTLEHIGLDNSLFTGASRHSEARQDDYCCALREFRRSLRPGGRLVLSVPFGKPGRFRWFQQFDSAGVGRITAAFDGRVLDMSFFKYEPDGWIRSLAAACADCEYFDIHAQESFDRDCAAAARAVACLDLIKPQA